MSDDCKTETEPAADREALYGFYGFGWLQLHTGVETEEAKEEKTRCDEIVEETKDARKALVVLREQLSENQKLRVAEMQQKADEIAETRDAHAIDELRREHCARIEEADAGRQRDKEQFQSEMAALRKGSDETVKRLSAAKLKERIGFLLPNVCAERRKLEAVKTDFTTEAKAMFDLQKLIWEQSREHALADASAATDPMLSSEDTTKASEDALRCELQLKQNALREKAMEVTDTVDAINEAVFQVSVCFKVRAEKLGESCDISAFISLVQEFGGDIH